MSNRRQYFPINVTLMSVSLWSNSIALQAPIHLTVYSLDLKKVTLLMILSISQGIFLRSLAIY